MNLKKVLLSCLFIFLLGFSMSNEAEASDVLSVDTINSLNQDNFSDVGKIMEENYDISNMSQKELDDLAVKLLNLQAQKNKDKLYTRASPGYGRLTSKEKELAAKYPAESVSCFNLATKATNQANITFSNTMTDGSDGNAFRHFFWNLLMADKHGVSVAERWGTAHEYGMTGVDTTMDLNNNKLGRESIYDFRKFVVGTTGRSPNNADFVNWGGRFVFNGNLYRVNRARNILERTTGVGYTGRI